MAMNGAQEVGKGLRAHCKPASGQVPPATGHPGPAAAPARLLSPEWAHRHARTRTRPHTRQQKQNTTHCLSFSLSLARTREISIARSLTLCVSSFQGLQPLWRVACGYFLDEHIVRTNTLHHALERTDAHTSTYTTSRCCTLSTHTRTHAHKHVHKARWSPHHARAHTHTLSPPYVYTQYIHSYA